MMNSKEESGKKIRIFILLFLSLMTIIATALYILASKSMESDNELLGDYKGHYAFVVSDVSDDFLDVVYSEISARIEPDGYYIEKIGANLSGTYTLAQKMEIAMATKPRGIIIMPDDSPEIRSLIKAAVGEGMIVVTIMNDAPGTERQSYVGSNQYDIGKEYGEQLGAIERQDAHNVAVLLNGKMSINAQNSFYQGIVAGVADSGRRFNINMINLDNSSDISMEEAVRTLIIDESNGYDVIIALDVETTQYAYQAMVDYNRVADISIIGFYISDIILNGIKVGNLNGSVTLNPFEVADNCVKVLYEYYNYGYSNYYIPVSIQTITKDNVDEYWSEITTHKDE